LGEVAKMGYSDRLLQEIEEKRKAAGLAVAAYISSLTAGRKALDPKTSAREKIDVLLPPIAKFNEILKIGSV
jgi:hypothetical protein